MCRLSLLFSAPQQLKALAAGAAPELLGMARSIPQHYRVLSILHRLWDCGTAAKPAVGTVLTSGLLLVNGSGFTGRFHHPVLVTRVIPAGFFCPAKTHITQKRVQLGAASPQSPCCLCLSLQY